MSRDRDLAALGDAELREAALLLEAVLDAIPDVIGLQDRHHRVIRYNEAGYRFLGIDAEEARGRRCYELIGRARPCEPCATSEAYRTRRPARVSRRIDEMGIDLDIRAYPVLDDAGEVIRVVEHLRDVTEERRLEERLRQMEKMETLGQLAGGVAHDFNNLLSPILGYADILIGEFALDDPRRAQLEVIKEAAERARALTRQLLAFGHKQVLELRAVDVAELLLGFERVTRRAIREDIAMTVRLPGKPTTVRGDLHQLQQVLMNLALNAQDAMPSGGALELDSAAVSLPAARQQGWPEVAPGEYVLLRCRDSGEGMDEATLARVFEPFFTTKEVGRGTGLGLATAHGVVAQHGGAIWASSEVGVGTTFFVLLPAAGPEPAGRVPDRPPPALGRHGETVLVVEDDELVRGLAARLLSRAGFDVVVAASPAECLELLESGRLRPGVLLADVVMPGMSGPELYERLRVVDPSLRAVFMSGYPRAEATRRGLGEGALPLLQKPFTYDALVAKVREAFDD